MADKILIRQELKTTTLQSSHIDELYHLLRLVSNTGDAEFSSIIFGLCRHLLDGGDYTALLEYLDYYGTNALLPTIASTLKRSDFEFDRLVEFGAGNAWMSKGISGHFGLLPVIKIDKRPWPGIDYIADLEDLKDRSKITGIMKPNDLIVMSEFLHCIDNTAEVMTPFKYWNKIIIEYMPTVKRWGWSYDKQIRRYGCEPLSSGYLEMIFGKKQIVNSIDINPYRLILVRKE